MSETLPAFEAPNPHPIQLVVTDDLRRNRLTVLLRLILAIPHLVWISLWSFAVGLAVLVAWVVAIFACRVPAMLHEFTPAASQSRLTVLFRLILAIPAAIVASVLQNVAWIVAILAWFYALFTGEANKGMRDLQAYCVRYQSQTYAYLLLLTQRYPSFSDE